MLGTYFERNEPKGYGEKGSVSLQNLIQQESGVLIACRARLYLIGIGDIQAQVYLEAIVVETSSLFGAVFHLG